MPAVHVDADRGRGDQGVHRDRRAPPRPRRSSPLTAAELAAAPQVPEITDFSVRGPSTTTGGDILKPDIAAPGNDVVAAVAPPSNHGRSWDFMSGTSMASPHIAGIGALLKARHPDLAAVRDQVGDHDERRRHRVERGRPFAQGAGFVNRTARRTRAWSTRRPPNEYRQYLVGLGVQFAPPFDTLTPISGPDLNQASIAIGRLAGVQTVTRRVKNVGTHERRPTRPTVSLPGFDVERDAVAR